MGIKAEDVEPGDPFIWEYVDSVSVLDDKVYLETVNTLAGTGLSVYGTDDETRFQRVTCPQCGHRIDVRGDIR